MAHIHGATWYYESSSNASLPTTTETTALPKAWKTLGKEVSMNRQQLLCRVLFVGHSTKTLPSATWYSAKQSRRHGAR
jgi:hypothetical protein